MRVKKKSKTSIMARFGDNSDSTILKALKFLNKLLGQAIPYSAAIIEVWLDRTFVYFNCSVHWNKWPDPIKSTYTRGYFFRDFMNDMKWNILRVVFGEGVSVILAYPWSMCFCYENSCTISFNQKGTRFMPFRLIIFAWVFCFIMFSVLVYRRNFTLLNVEKLALGIFCFS